MARLAAAHGRGGVRGPGTLTAAARTASAGLATLLRAVATDGDRLWTPEPVEPERLPVVDGLPRPELVSGRLELLPIAPGTSVLAWGETSRVAALRKRAGSPSLAGSGDLADLADLTHQGDLPDWVETLRRLPPAAPEVVARVNDRRFCLALAGGLGRALPGARTVRSATELADHLRSGACGAGGGAWVAKAPWSAAGRHRVIAPGRDALLDAAVSRRVERLLERSGELVVEPWVQRTADYGAAGLVRPDGRVESLGSHRLEVDRRGVFTGLVLDGPGPAERQALETTLAAVGRSLSRAGYVGPFGIDGFSWTEPAGGTHGGGAAHLHPLSEINARWTFGLVARALLARVAGAPEWTGGAARTGRVALRLGRRGREAEAPVSVRSRTIELLAATENAPGAWLELEKGTG